MLASFTMRVWYPETPLFDPRFYPTSLVSYPGFFPVIHFHYLLVLLQPTRPIYDTPYTWNKGRVCHRTEVSLYWNGAITTLQLLVTYSYDLHVVLLAKQEFWGSTACILVQHHRKPPFPHEVPRIVDSSLLDIFRKNFILLLTLIFILSSAQSFRVLLNF